MQTQSTDQAQSLSGASALGTAILLGSLSFGILQFALPIYAKGLGASALDVGGIVSAFALVITLARPLVGWGLDHMGRKPFLASSFLFYAFAMLLFGLSRDLRLLLVARLVQGLGSALLWIPAYTVATELTSRDWGKSVGGIDMASARGGLLGTFVGFPLLFIADKFTLGWRWMFEAYAVAALIAGVLIWRAVPETRPARAQPDSTQRKDVQGFDRKLLSRLMLIVFLTGTSSSMISPLLMIFLQDRFSTDFRVLATAYLPAALVYAFLPGRLGGLSDRFGRAPLMAIGLIGAAFVSVWMPSTPSLVVLAALWVVESVGYSAATPAEEAFVADLAGESVRGTGYGLYMFAAGLGFTVGPVLGGWLYDAAGHAVPFYINGAVLCLGAGLVLRLLMQQRGGAPMPQKQAH